MNPPPMVSSAVQGRQTQEGNVTHTLDIRTIYTYRLTYSITQSKTTNSRSIGSVLIPTPSRSSDLSQRHFFSMNTTKTCYIRHLIKITTPLGPRGLALRRPMTPTRRHLLTKSGCCLYNQLIGWCNTSASSIYTGTSASLVDLRNSEMEST